MFLHIMQVNSIKKVSLYPHLLHDARTFQKNINDALQK